MEKWLVTQETGAEYYVRELSDGTFVWVGEALAHSSDRKDAVNVFFGRRISATQVRGDFFDVPKGRASAVHRNLAVTTSGGQITFLLPRAGQRTLVDPRYEFISNDGAEWGCGFYDEEPGSASHSLTGVWRSSTGGHYYVRQVGSQLVWFGEHPSLHWSNVYLAEISGDRITGRWIDVPKGRARSSGELDLRIETTSLFPGQSARVRLVRTRATGGASGSGDFRKTDSLRIAFRPEQLTIVRNNDHGSVHAGGDEPYLLPLYVTIGGNEYTNPGQILSGDSSERPRVVSPLYQHAWGTSNIWPKRNITWQVDLVPGTTVRVPEYIGYAETELRTFDGLEPNSTLARESALFLPGIAAVEERLTRHEDIRAGYIAMLARAPDVIHRDVMRALLRQPREAQRILGQVFFETVVRGAISDFFGWGSIIEPDTLMGTNFTDYNFGSLRQAALEAPVAPVTMEFQGDQNGLWRLDGALSSIRGPARFNREFTSLEVTLETGGDGMDPGSMVRLGVDSGDRTPRLVDAHPRGHFFPSGARHSCSVPVSPPVILGNQRGLRLDWQRRPGDGLLRQPDTWDLRSVRVAAFDRFHRRHVLLAQQVISERLGDNRTLTIPLPRH